ARSYILANAIEAVIGAVYLDSGMDACRRIIGAWILTRLPSILETKSYLDPKSRFQEIAQEKFGITPRYQVLEESGPDHNKNFRVGVFIETELIATGEGLSKQDAQIQAAERALQEKGWS
ncbi:ribonuclease III, partial [Candidatus Uhrbacteria bacterium]|nr:ribonuclease III [Candidatus Uhrbacteria bacterium]